MLFWDGVAWGIALSCDKPTQGEPTAQANHDVPDLVNDDRVGQHEAPAGTPLAVLIAVKPTPLLSTPAQLPQWRTNLAHIRMEPVAPAVSEPAIGLESIVPVVPVAVVPVAVVPVVAPRLVIPDVPRSQVLEHLPVVPARSWLSTIWQTSVRAMWWGSIAGFVWLISMLGVIAALRFVDPPGSMLMAMQRLSGQEIKHTWVPLEQVSNTVRRAVMVAEDGKFCQHQGFDFGEIRAAMRAGDGFGRGASTITQQVAKNMFLWPGKSYVRKALEVPLTVAIEAMWSKPRILEVYLSIAEWGPGLFGIEAAAQSYFGRPASQVSERQAALLAVVLPNPIKRDVSDPSPDVQRRAAKIQARMRVTGGLGCGLG